MKIKNLLIALVVLALPVTAWADNVAKIGNVEYETLAEAVTAAQSGETILMITDVTDAAGIKVDEGKNFTIDFQNHTYTLNKPGAGSSGTETNGFQLLKNSTIVLKNGTINIAEDNLTPAVAPAKNIMRVIQNYANLTLDNMTIDGTNQYGGKDYVISFNNGTSLLKDTKVIAGTDNIAFDVCTWSSYKASNLEVDGSSEITGNIEISSSNTPDELKLTLTAGTISGNIVMADGADKATVTKSAAFEQDAPEGYKWVEGTNGTSTLAECEYVAQVGEQKYETLAEAITAVQSGETILMITDVTDAAGIKVDEGKNFTIDFQNHTYTLNKPGAGSSGTETNGFQLLKNSTIVLKNGTINIAEDNLTPAVAPAKNIMRVIQNYANLTLDNMTIDGTNQYGGKDYVISFNNGTSLLKDTKVIAGTDNIAFDVCTWSSYKASNLEVDGSSEITGNIEISSSNTPDELKLTLTAGTISGNIVMADGADKATVTKSAAFEQDAPEGYKWVEGEDGMQTLAACEYVAQVGEDKYETLAEAIEAVQSGETILMIADVTDAAGIKVAEGKYFTIDFQNHTYTLNKPGAGSAGTETNGFQLLKNSTIVLKNGTINIAEDNLTPAVAPAKNIMRIIQNYANLTLENMTVDGTNQYGGKDYVISFNNGTSVIKDTKVIAGADNIAFDVCTWSSYKATGLEVNGNSEITGSIEISSSNQPEELSLTLTSGTLSGNIIMAGGADKCTVTKADTFEQDAPEGYKWVEGEDGMQTLAACEYAAQVGEDRYETLAEAITAAQGTSVVTLLADVAETYTMSKNETLKIKKNGFTFEVAAPEGDFKVVTEEADGVTTYTVAALTMEEKDIVLVDGEPYTFTADTQVKSATYTRNYDADRVGKFQAWSMPFDFTITEEAAGKFTFYRINMIAHSANPNEEVQSTDKLWVYVAPMKAGEKLTANRPYAYKPKAEGEFTFAADNNKLYAPDYTSRLHTETVDHGYDFFGTYNTVSMANLGGDFYYLNAKGEISHAKKETTTVDSYRWIVKATNKSGANYAPRFEFVEEGAETEGIRSISAGDDVEGYYTLGGTRVETPHHGMFVVKYKNGNIKKQFIK